MAPILTPLLQVRGLSVAFAGRRVVDGLDLDVAAGEIVGLVGPSGSGKSLSARAILGLTPPGAEVTGSVRLDGRELVGLPERALCEVRGGGLGLVFQEPSTALDPVMPLGEQVAEGLRRRGASRHEARVEALAWLGRVGLDPAAVPPGRRPHQLSGGQRQRVAIAAALALHPAVLIADEPTTALDAITQAQIAALLVGLSRSQGLGLLLVSHDLPLLAGLADRLVALQHGRLVVAGSTLDVLDDPRSRLRTLRQAFIPAPRTVLEAVSDEVTSRPVVLEVEGLWRSYTATGAGSSLFRRRPPAGAPGLRDVSFRLHAGERLAVVGETGAGKSTLLRLVLGLERPDRGQVRLHGALFSPASSAAQRALRAVIQPVFQDPASSFDPRWSVGRIVAEPLALLDPPLSAQASTARVEEVLQQVGLSPGDALRPARAFSGGQRQRIALARALAVRPQVLVLDEATSALDTASRADILTLLDGLTATTGLACLLVTHDLALVRAFADTVAVLQAGRIVETGPVASVLAAPNTAYTRALLTASPDLEQVIAERRTR